MKVELSELEIEEIIREHFGGKIQNYRMSKVSSWTLGRNNRKISTEKVFVTLDVENENDTEKNSGTEKEIG